MVLAVPLLRGLKVYTPDPWVGGWVGKLKKRKALSRGQNISFWGSFGFDSTPTGKHALLQHMLIHLTAMYSSPCNLHTAKQCFCWFTLRLHPVCETKWPADLRHI